MKAGRFDDPRVQRWLSRSLEPDEQRARLKKGDFRGAESAFFELAIESHLRARRVPTAKPSLPSGRPDLLVRHPAGDVYLEVATIFDEPFWEQAGERVRLVASAIQQVSSPFWINLRGDERDVPPDIARRKVRGFVRQIVAETRAGRIALETEHRIPDTGLSVYLWGNREDETMPLGIQRSGVRALTGHVQVERALDDKASKYPEIKAAGLPYVVALCAGSGLVIGEEQIMSGVYGTIQVTISVAREPVSGPVPPPVAMRRGGMLAQRGDGSFNNREISAVLYVWEDLASRSEQRLRAKVLHHPEPLVPLPEAVFAYLPQTRFKRERDDDERVTIEFGDEPTDFDVD